MKEIIKKPSKLQIVDPRESSPRQHKVVAHDDTVVTSDRFIVTIQNNGRRPRDASERPMCG
jgi:hypothetical protein